MKALSSRGALAAAFVLVMTAMFGQGEALEPARLTPDEMKWVSCPLAPTEPTLPVTTRP